MTTRYRYSEWDGSQEIPSLDPDDVLASITDDLMNFGDLQHALRNLLQRGMRNPLGQRLQGLRDLLQQLRQSLDHNYYLKEFVHQIAKMNKGRVFYTTPDRLGQYILVDYVAQKRKQIRD
jgi:uncharacterized protein with von Willebrand factor type A (vWA) domain